MGIKGLLSFVNKNEVSKRIPLQPLTRGSHLLIDGNGYIFALLNYLNESEIECSYAQYRFVLKRELAYLRDDLGLHVEVYFDGSERQLKRVTDKARKISRLNKWVRLYDIFVQNQSWERRDLPKPVLVQELMINTLREEGVSIEWCTGEADQDMALACQRLRSEGLSAYCYADDSDFWLMKGIGYIRFEDLISHRNIDRGALVWTRERFSQALGFPSEDILLEWSIAVGNDFTAGIDPNLYTNMPSFLFDGANMCRYDSLKKYMLEKGGDFRLHSHDESLTAAVEFSRKIYNLEDVSSFPLDSMMVDSDKEQVHEGTRHIQPLMSLSERHASKIEGFVHSLDKDIFAKESITAHEVGGMVIDYWTVAIFKPRSIKPVEASLPLEVDLADHLNPQNLEALRQMMDILSASDEHNNHVMESCLTAIPDVKTDSSLSTWLDFLAAHVYQLTCQQIMKCLRDKKFHQTNSRRNWKRRRDQFLRPVKVHKLYDPHVFTSCLSNIKQNDAKQAASKYDPVNGYISQDISFPCSNSDSPSQSSTNSVNVDLPIDKHRESILERIGRDRVTIIHGETGCGKSSRLPQMLLQHAEAEGLTCKMMVSQPRRIAASSLYNRVHQALGDKVGLRMGHGIKEEKDETKIFFVTTGYLVRLLAHRPSFFDDHSHLIIDEVHERSVDGDVLCLLAKRLLRRNRSIRVVLMSATIHVELYQEYFRQEAKGTGDTLQCLSVGVRRFPICIQYLEHLGHATRGHPESVLVINKMLTAKSSADLLKSNYIAMQYRVASMLTATVPLGSAVLIFVAGMNDIIELAEMFSSVSYYRVVAIHSEIPHEEQEAAFDQTQPGEVKVIIATNSAESSVTLPDVDTVICLGMHKMIRYDNLRHQEMLCLSLISKASATQRAGRTGRVRCGKVYRLYSEAMFEDMCDHDLPEVLRVPLQETILNLRIMLENSHGFEGVVPLLENLIDPPDMENVQASFDMLFDAGIINQPGDEGRLTQTGRFVGGLPVSIEHGRLIYFSVLTGLHVDGSIVAAALSLPRSPFRIASPIVHKDPKVFNGLVQKTFLAAVKFDKGAYSEPLMLLEVLKEYRKLETNGQRESFCLQNGLWKKRIRYFDSISKNLEEKVKSVLARSVGRGKQPVVFDEELPEEDDNDAQTEVKVTVAERNNLFRLFLLWTQNSCNILQYNKKKSVDAISPTSLQFNEPFLTPLQLEELLPSSVVPFSLRTEQSCIFSISVNSAECLEAMETRVKSPDEGDIDVHRNILENLIVDVVSIALLVDEPPLLWVKTRRDLNYGYALAIHQTKCEYHDAVIDYVNAIALACHEGSVVYPSDATLSGEFSSDYTIAIMCFQCESMKRVGKFDAMLKSVSPGSFRIHFIDTHPVKATSKNCNIPVPMLEAMFTEEYGPGVAVTTYFLQPTKQTVDFANSPLEVEQDEYNAHTCRALFDDVALGIRLMRAYRSGNNKGVLRVRCDPSGDVAHTTDRNEQVVGSKAWVDKHHTNSVHCDGMNTEDIEACIVNCTGTSGGSWAAVGSRQYASFPKYSVPAACVYTGADPFRAVASNILFTPQSVRCDGVTLLPPGDEWVFLALRCLGEAAVMDVLSDASIAQYENEVDVETLELIEELLCQQLNEKVKFNRDVTIMLLELFWKWTTMDKIETDCEDEGRE
eukprot:CAMPEP_0114465236 /NCGR_PEP_ID=MMETSP0104-20121206/8383_1 /TAXON_ID=37642 ORGANISM="Paraphysomonas imperforata, Strain PA2" /NCGR_SAMPLE_ID=MMETSP0104 /ASSEMBLY_ACC=CAM_ASM_000202 /LENGTH=1658 /DNA_ID=CAMNT_0001638425 /DNA_START=38 /DNA_END=5014 /DNA_ORIENTATION=+